MKQRLHAVASARIRRAAGALAGLLPGGAVIAGLVIAMVHAAFCWIVSPYPIARQDLRHKILALTEGARPNIVFAGDSRAECGVIPDVVAREMKLGEGAVINIAVEAGDTVMTLAAYREFAGRFARNPIIVISISPHHVSDRGPLNDHHNFEYYWSLDAAARFSSLSVGDALRATFSPERRWFRSIQDGWNSRPSAATVRRGGYRALEEPPVDTPENGYAKTITRLAAWRCFGIDDDTSLPWRRLEEDLERLRALGAQLVVLDAPDHPAFLTRLEGTANGDNYAHFRATLARLCTRLRIPLLRYSAASLGSVDLDQAYWDGVHVNARAAPRLSRLIATELNRLLSQGVLSMPSPEGAPRS